MHEVNRINRVEEFKMRPAFLQSLGLIELNDTEQLSVADHRKGQPQQYQDRE